MLCEKFENWGLVYDEMEKIEKRTTEWNDSNTVVECLIGFYSEISTEKSAKLIYILKNLVLRRNKDYRLFPGSYREKPTHFSAENISV